MKDHDTRRTTVSATVGLVAMIALAMNSAEAEETCRASLEDLYKNWATIAVPGPRPESADSEQEKHPHSAPEIEYMRSQLRLAARRCDEGNDHEALLRMDVVRAWLRLPEVQHPSDHRYRRQSE